MKINAKNNDILLSLYVDSEGLANTKEFNNCIYSIAKQRKAVDLVVFHSGLSKDELKQLTSVLDAPSLTLIKADEEGNPVEENVKFDGDKLNYTVVETEADSFAKLFNLGFNYAKSNGYELYSIAEQGDAFAIHWFERATTYASEEENHIFLPLIRNTMNGAHVSMLNEAACVEGMSVEDGIKDINLLLRFNAVNPLGGVYNVEAISEISEEKDGLVVPMKESMKLTNSYEFFLRMIYEDLKVKTIDRVGYELKAYNREDFKPTSSKIPNNLVAIAPDKGGVSQDEVNFYQDLAKKEYFFEEDRGLVFES